MAPPTPDEFRDVADLRSALRLFLRRSGEIAARNGLTPRYHLLLLMIKGAADGSERSTVSELTQRLQLTQSTVTQLVQRAEGDGLVYREPSTADRRVVYLRLTEEGERRIAASVSDHGPERRMLLEIVQTIAGPETAGGVPFATTARAGGTARGSRR